MIVVGERALDAVLVKGRRLVGIVDQAVSRPAQQISVDDGHVALINRNRRVESAEPRVLVPVVCPLVDQVVGHLSACLRLRAAAALLVNTTD